MEASTSGTLRTRSHSRADPPWTLQDMLILVNEIAVVEGDCQNALSTYQKWSMIAENCTALEVVRNSSQCRRKWESLLNEYKLIRHWEANSGEDSYWSFGFEQRKETGLPKNFDKQLYEAIDNFTKLQDQADTDPEDDPEAAEMDFDAEESDSKSKRVRRRSTAPKKITLDRKRPVLEEEVEKPVPLVEGMGQIPTDSKPKRLRHRSTPQKGNSEEEKQPTEEEKPETSVHVAEEIEQIPIDSKPKRSRHRSSPQKGNIDEEKQFKPEDLESMPVVEEMEQVLEDPKPKRARRQSNPKKALPKEKKQFGLEEELEKADARVLEIEQILAEKLKGNTEVIHAILAENLTETVDDKLDDPRGDDTLKTERVRCRADKLISCLVDLAKNLEQLCDVVEKR